jgi:hypothetical protein
VYPGTLTLAVVASTAHKAGTTEGGLRRDRATDAGECVGMGISDTDR